MSDENKLPKFDTVNCPISEMPHRELEEAKKKPPYIHYYNPGMDAFVEVTQDWVDKSEEILHTQQLQRELAQNILNYSPAKDRQKLLAIKKFLFSTSLTDMGNKE